MFHRFHFRVQRETLLVCFGGGVLWFCFGGFVFGFVAFVLVWVFVCSLTNMQSLHPSLDDLCTPHTWRPNSCKKRVIDHGSQLDEQQRQPLKLKEGSVLCDKCKDKLPSWCWNTTMNHETLIA